MKFEHTAYNVPQPDRQAAWYIAHLGMVMIRLGGGPTNIHFVGEPGGRFVLEFYNNPNGPLPDYAGISVWTQHVAFTSADLKADRDRLVAAGGKADGDLITLPSGDATVFVRDPWGLAIQLIQRLKPLV
ncbi:MAG: VOC family protein [Thermoflexales bacterium]|nr:VOC family protein [Thermoflexales bacterium]